MDLFISNEGCDVKIEDTGIPHAIIQTILDVRDKHDHYIGDGESYAGTANTTIQTYYCWDETVKNKGIFRCCVSQMCFLYSLQGQMGTTIDCVIDARYNTPLGVVQMWGSIIFGNFFATNGDTTTAAFITLRRQMLSGEEVIIIILQKLQYNIESSRTKEGNCVYAYPKLWSRLSVLLDGLCPKRFINDPFRITGVCYVLEFSPIGPLYFLRYCRLK